MKHKPHKHKEDNLFRVSIVFSKNFKDVKKHNLKFHYFFLVQNIF